MLTHVDSQNKPNMVDVSDKEITKRVAKAKSLIWIPKEVLELIKDGDIQSKKGPVFDTAIISGTMAVKKTADLIPFCHQVPIDGCKLTITIDSDDCIEVTCEVNTAYKTGVEMEALVGASVAALTIYDMLKAVSQKMILKETKLVFKSGGKKDFKNEK